jgi:hypothetical protein
MKRLIMCSLFVLTMFLFGADAGRVRAQEGNCIAGNVSELLMMDSSPLKPSSGTTFSWEKIEPENVVVVGQDPVERTGVTISVTLTSVTGRINHDELETVTDCVGPFSMNDLSKTTCGHSSPGYYYYLLSRQECVHETYDKAYRTVKAVRVWLQPTGPTSEWLGWKPVTSDNRAALRYLYPEKWMVGTWTRDGFITQGTTDLRWSSADYQAWLDGMKDYNFLAGDSISDVNLWSRSLDVINSPLQGGPLSLGLKGEFDIAHGAYAAPDRGLGMTTIDCFPTGTEYANPAAGCTVDPPLGSDSQSYEIRLKNIPLDLPGQWYVGVMVEMKAAHFQYPEGAKTGKTITEKTNWATADEMQWFEPTVGETGYDIKGDSFYSYIILTTPCNIEEKNGCFDGSY